MEREKRCSVHKVDPVSDPKTNNGKGRVKAMRARLIHESGL